MMRSIPNRPSTSGVMFLAIGLTLLVGDCGRADEPKTNETKDRPANRLARETSPYLLMHAHNPVDWYPWGPEAFAKAKKEGKFVFLSIGYSSCYWCHVMERESFENPEVAKLLNQWFVCIKVDREERPDIDTIYMTSLNVLGQRGGWPLSMFLTAEGKPIVGGTYWPPEDRKPGPEEEGPKTIAGFKSILKIMHDLQKDKSDELLKQADKVAELTADNLAQSTRGIALVELKRGLVTEALEAIKVEYDKEHGGFGNPARGFRGTKFPMPPYLELALYETGRTKSTELTAQVQVTLNHLARGGIYDQLGGGFHRYSTERTWTVPHFEKMLYDNAQLVEVYARAHQQTKQPLYRQIVEETLAFVRREMTAPEGGFYSALDAETKGEEGRFYVWTDKEIDGVLGDPKDIALVKKVYAAEGKPNFEGKYNILTLAKPLADIAKDMSLTENELRQRLAPLTRKLLEVRAQRPRPFLDTKILTAWNGQMIAGLAVAGKIHQETQYVEAAARAADFLLKNSRTREGRLLRTFSAQPGQKGEARLNAYLDDYAYLVHGLLCLNDATGEARWLQEAKSLTDTMVQFHADKDRGGFFFTSNDHEKLFARSKDQHDGVQPSGNSMAARNLVRLWTKTGDERYRKLAEKTFMTFAGALKANPSGMTTMAQALGEYLDAQEGEVQKVTAKKEPVAEGKKGKDSESVVKVEAKADKPDGDGNQVVTVTLTIDKGWHTYKDPLPEDFPGKATKVAIDAKVKPQEVKVDYPEGKLVKDPDLGDHYIYEGKVSIKARVKRAKGDTGPLDVSVTIQACSKSCLMPTTVKLTVP